MAGVKRSTLARWKKEDDEVELALDQARFQYQAPRLAKIDDTRMKDGQHDWRAQAWLVKFANPEVYGAPSRRRKLRDVEVDVPLTPEEQQAKEQAELQAEVEQACKDWKNFNSATGVITPMMLSILQQRRAIALRAMKEKKPAAAQGSAPAEDGAPGQNVRTEEEPAGTSGAASAESGAEAAKSVTIRPEIHGLYRDPGAWARPAAPGAAPRRPAAMAG
jgi:hypothetical protein